MDDHAVAVFVGGDVRIAGGLSSMAFAVVRALESSGKKVHGYMPNWRDGRGWGVENVEWQGTPWKCVRYRRSTNFGAALQVGYQLRQELRDYSQVWAVVGTAIWTLALTYASNAIGAAWVATPIEEEFVTRFRGTTVMRRALLGLVLASENVAEGIALRRGGLRRIFALSHATRNILTRRHRLQRERLEVLYPPIDTHVFHPNGARPVRTNRCITVARLDDRRKDIASLIDIWPAVVREIPDAELILVGPFEDGGVAERAVLSSPVRRSIFMTGSLSPASVSDEMRRSDLFILPSRQEGLGIVVMEALACGVPVIAYENGGTDELLRLSEGSKTVAQGDTSAFVREIVGALKNGPPSTAAARAARFLDASGTANFTRTVVSQL